MTQNNDVSSLKTVLLANGLFSGSSGLVLALFPGWIGALLGYQFSTIYVVIGVVLLVYAGQLFVQLRSKRIHKLWLWWFILADLIWVAGSIVILWGDLFISTSFGRWLVAIVAGVVGLFALLQYLGYAVIQSTPQAQKSQG